MQKVTHGVCNKRQASRKGNPLPSGITSICWHLHLHSAQQHWGNRASVTRMDAGRNYRDFCHFLPPPVLPSPHSPLCTYRGCGCQLLYQSGLTHPTSFSPGLQPVTVNKAMGKKLHHIHKIRHISNQARR